MSRLSLLQLPPSTAEHLEKAPVLEVGGRVGKWLLEVSQSAPIFLRSSALFMYWHDLTSEDTQIRSLDLWRLSHVFLHTLILSFKDLSWLEEASCPSLPSWLILKWELEELLFCRNGFYNQCIYSCSLCCWVFEMFKWLIKCLKCSKKSVTLNLLLQIKLFKNIN